MDAYTEAARRTATYGEDEWRAIRAQPEEIVSERVDSGLAAYVPDAIAANADAREA
jgi:hypothetical protein